MCRDLVAVIQLGQQVKIRAHAGHRCGQLVQHAVEPARRPPPARRCGVRTQDRHAAEPAHDAADALVLLPERAVVVVVARRADQHQIADLGIPAPRGVGIGEQAAEAPAVQRQRLAAGVFADPRQQRRHQPGDVGLEPPVILSVAGTAPVDQIDHEAARQQVADQAALREQVVDRHVDRERRHQHHRHRVAHGHTRQRPVSTQSNDAVFENQVVRRALGLHQLLRVEDAIAQVDEAARGARGAGGAAGFRNGGHRRSISAGRSCGANCARSFTHRGCYQLRTRPVSICTNCSPG